MNRRELLRTGSLGTLGLIASQTFQTTLGQNRTVGANERIRIGIVGFSDRLRTALLPAYKAVADEFNCEIVAVSDLWSRRREDAKAYFTKNFGPIVAAKMTWNVNQPGRWRRPDLVAATREQDTDWKRFLCNRPEAKWDPRKYLEGAKPATTSANTGADELTTAHMKNWLECLRSPKQPHAPVKAGYQHSIATIMANAPPAPASA